MSEAKVDQLLAEQAAALHEAVIRGEPGSGERLAAWLESPRHLQHYMMMTTLDVELRNVDRQQQWTLRSAVQSNVVELSDTAPRCGPSVRRPKLYGIAATTLLGLVLLALASWFTGPWGSEVYATDIGEQRSVELADGSLVHLNTNSRLRVQMTDTVREIRLEAGEALFKVRRDPERPFRVLTSDAVIQAIGTQFNVYRRAGGTTVAVLEGKVRVEAANSGSAATGVPQALGEGVTASKSTPAHTAAHLVAGQQAEVTHTGAIATAAADETAIRAVWQQRRLVFQSTPLGEVVSEFNRYNRAPQLVLASPEVASKVYSGIFDANDPDSLIALLEKEADLDVERRTGSVVIRAIEPGSAAPEAASN